MGRSLGFTFLSAWSIIVLKNFIKVVSSESVVHCFQTRMQCLVPDPRANYRNVVHALYRIVRYEGVRNTVRGITAVVGGSGPAHALYFASYEYLKKTLSTIPGNVHGTAVTQGMYRTLIGGKSTSSIHVCFQLFCRDTPDQDLFCTCCNSVPRGSWKLQTISSAADRPINISCQTGQVKFRIYLTGLKFGCPQKCMFPGV